MKKIGIFILLISNYAAAQTVKVLNISNLKPIENVLIFNEKQTKSAITDYKGNADISAFDSTETLLLQHPAYQRLKTSYSDLRKNRFKIKLTESFIKIDEVLISANKWEQKGNEIPNKIVSIRSSDIEIANPQTSADLLKSTNEVFVQKSQLGGGSPMIRGFSANSVLLVYDGVRMNNAIYRSGNLHNVISIDPNILESAEIIFGPGSVIYGSDALGGVMDFHTLKPRLTSNGEPFIKSNSLVRWSSANNENTGHVDINIGFQKWGFLTSISFSDFDDLVMGNSGNKEYQRDEFALRVNGKDTILPNMDQNEQKFSQYSQFNFSQKVRFKPSKFIDFNYGLHLSRTSNIPRYDRLIQYSDDQLKYARWSYGPMHWLLNTLNVKYTRPLSIFDQVNLNVAYQDYEESRITRRFKDPEETNRTEQVGMYSLNLDFDKSFSESTEIYYGVEGIYNSVNSTGKSTNIETDSSYAASSRYPGGLNNYFTLAAYVSVKHKLSDKIHLNSGLRYSYQYLKSTFTDTVNYNFPYNEIKLTPSALNGSLGLVYQPFKKTSINANLSSGFRAPNLDDVAKVFDSEPGKVMVPNKDLKPEYAYNFDLGFEQRLQDYIKLEFTFFYTHLNNVMVRRNTTFNGQDSIFYEGTLSQVQTIVNADKGKIYGCNAGIYVTLTNHFSMKSNLTLMDGEDSDGFPVRHVAPAFHITHLIYTTEKLKADFYMEYNGEISADDLALSERDKTHMYKIDANGNAYSPSWYTLNLKLAYQLNEYIQMNVGLENILDHRYRPYSSGIVAPGRNLIVGLRANL